MRQKLYVEEASELNCIAWSPDGEVLASGSEFGGIRFWNIQTGEVLQTLEWRGGDVASLTWSPDGEVLASGSEFGGIRFWNIQTGEVLQTLEWRGGDVASLTWSPDGEVLASGSEFGGIRFWNIQTGEVLQTLEWRGGDVASLTWSPDGEVLASGFEDGTVRLWNAKTGQLLLTLEGHITQVSSVSFSSEGHFLASKSKDGSVQIWRVETGAVMVILKEKPSNARFSGVAFHPKQPMLATFGGESGEILIWDLDMDAVLNTSSYLTSSVRYITAKIALLGDSGVGKSGLGYRLAEDRFQVTELTHGQQFWVVDKLGKIRDDGTQCEGVMWDFAGQPNFRPIHSLFLDDVDLVLVLFDPARPDTLAGVDYWLKQLSQNQQQYRTVLVAARTDVSPLSTSPAEMEAYCRERNISGGFVATSAKMNKGINTLLDIVRKQIDWNAKVTTVTTQTFKRVKDYVLDLKANMERKNVLVRQALLRAQLEETDLEWQFSDAEMMVAIAHLQNHGYVTVLRRSSEEERILLAPDLLINLAASFMLKAQANERGLGALDEVRVLRNEYTFREVQDLSDDERDTLLNAVTELFLKRNICFRETVDYQTFLIFPSLIFDRPPRMTGDEEIVESTVYVVTGQVENIYPALVVLLGYSPSFQRTSQWRKQAQYETIRGEICGFKLANDDPGELELVLYYSMKTQDFTKRRFQGLFEEILYTRNVCVKQYQPIFCPKCGRQQERGTVIRRLIQGKNFLWCEDDGEKIHLQPVEERLSLSAEVSSKVIQDRNLTRMRTSYEAALVRVKGLIRDRGDVKAPMCFISYAWGDSAHERWVVKLAEDLRKADIDVVLDQWDDYMIGSNIVRFITRIATSEFIVVVGTPSYLKKYENTLSPYGNVLAAEGDLINLRLTGTEAQKASILPVLLQGDQNISLPTLLQGHVYYDFTREEKYFVTLFDLLLNVYQISFDNTVIRDYRIKLEIEAEEVRLQRT